MLDSTFLCSKRFKIWVKILSVIAQQLHGKLGIQGLVEIPSNRARGLCSGRFLDHLSDVSRVVHDQGESRLAAEYVEVCCSTWVLGRSNLNFQSLECFIFYFFIFSIRYLLPEIIALPSGTPTSLHSLFSSLPT